MLTCVYMCLCVIIYLWVHSNGFSCQKGISVILVLRIFWSFCEQGYFSNFLVGIIILVVKCDPLFY